MKRIIRLVDRTLARTMHLWAYWDDPQAMFRIRVIPAPHDLHLSDSFVPKGAKVLELHFWNEHSPSFSAKGPDLAWAMKAYRMIRPSFRMLFRELQTNPDLEGIQALGGSTVLVTAGGESGSEKLFHRMGLELFPYRGSMGRFGKFWDNLYSWLLMWAYNDFSVRQRDMLDLQRSDVWISTAKFLRLHGEDQGEATTVAAGAHSSP